MGRAKEATVVARFTSYGYSTQQSSGGAAARTQNAAAVSGLPIGFPAYWQHTCSALQEQDERYAAVECGVRRSR